MSIPVKIEDLAKTYADFDQTYLLTSDGEGVKVVCVEMTIETDGIRIPTGSKGTARNLERSATVTIMCPPREPRGWTLIVDGTARVDGEGFRVLPTKAVLHRPASHADGPVADGACGHDCKPAG